MHDGGGGEIEAVVVDGIAALTWVVVEVEGVAVALLVAAAARHQSLPPSQDRASSR